MSVLQKDFLKYLRVMKKQAEKFSSVGCRAIYKTVKARQLLREAKKHFFVAYYNNCGIFQ